MGVARKDKGPDHDDPALVVSAESKRKTRPSGSALPLPLAGEGWGEGDASTDARSRDPSRLRERSHRVAIKVRPISPQIAN
ncbi:hypothetical protein DY468_22490 [Rhodopseudomonas sp. BR0M22]|nr:hypothetical protein [Rhodopseudomonas sp. BR0M22]